MPTKKELAKTLEALISNGLDFLEKSTKELETEPAFSVSHFATGIELLLKARLFSEHWTLVSTRPHSTTWSQIKDGGLMSIQASELTSAITSVTGTPLATEAKLLEKVFAHRNQALHFVPSQGVREIVAEQFRIWFYLHRHLTNTWKDVYSVFQTRITKVDDELRKHKKCLKVRFDELSKASRFKGPKHKGNLIVCPVCEFESGILEDSEAFLTELSCPVCVSVMEVADFGCGNWHSFADGFFGDIHCDCGEKHQASDLAALMDDQQPMSPKEQSIAGDTRFACGECLEPDTVVAHGSGYRCFACGETFDDGALDHCEWCNLGWVGYDCSETNWSGCEHCDGNAGHVMGKDD